MTKARVGTLLVVSLLTQFAFAFPVRPSDPCPRHLIKVPPGPRGLTALGYLKRLAKEGIFPGAREVAGRYGGVVYIPVRPVWMESLLTRASRSRIRSSAVTACPREPRWS